MKSKFVARTVLASVAISTLFGTTQSLAGCLSVEGEILNSLHDPALGSIFTGSDYIGGVSTAGVVALKGEKPIGKLKCALVGAAVGLGETPPGSPLPALPDFTHTISCDDSVEVEGGIVHSQLTFDTSGYFTGYDGACTLFFTENSVPRTESGKGAFDGANSGFLAVEGTSNICTNSIDMTFTGEVCFD